MAMFLLSRNKAVALLSKRVPGWALTLFFSLSLLFISYSCSYNQVNSDSDITVIDFVSGLKNPRVIDLSEIATDIEYIPLETTKESLIGPFSTISTGNNRIYVMSRKNIQIFDKKGTFLFTFNRKGRGPEEYIISSGFQFEEETGNIIVNAFTQGFVPFAITYDSLGRFLFSEQIARVNSVFIPTPIKFNDNLYLGSVPEASKIKLDFWIVAFQKDGSVLKKFPSPPFKHQDYLDKQAQSLRISKDGEATSVNNLSPRLYRVGNYIRVFSKFIDTLYTIDTQLEYKPEFVINCGNIKADGTSSVPIGEKMDEGDFIILREGKFQEWGNNILFNYYLNKYAFEPYETSMTTAGSKMITRKHTDAYALYNKEKGSFTFMKQPIKGKLGFRDNLKGGPPFIPQFISQDNKYAVSLLSAEDILEHAQTGQMKGDLKKIAYKMSEMDNHVVVVVKLK